MSDSKVVEVEDDAKAIKRARQHIWASAGKDITGAKSAGEALKMAGLDWKVSKEPLFTRVNGSYKRVPNKFGIVRDKDQTTLGIVGSDYREYQNEEGFALTDQLAESGAGRFCYAGDQRGGQVVWVMMKLGEKIKVAGIDPIDMFATFFTSHDGSRKIFTRLVPIRDGCLNVLDVMLRSTLQTSASVTHNSTLDKRLAEAREALKGALKYGKEFGRIGTVLAKSKFAQKDFDRFLKSLLPQEEKKAEQHALGITALYKEAPNLENHRGTRWAALNAVGEYFDHVREYRTPAAALNSAVHGLAFKRKARAFDLLTADLAEVHA